MGIEIERKFLVNGDEWRQLGEGILYRQGYLNTDKGRTVRVRTIQERAYLTIKGPTINASRAEYEYEIPIEDALEMLSSLCISPVIEKKRHTIQYMGHAWEVDEFQGENEGLIFAEIELTDRDEQFAIPPWIGREVTHDPRFYNSALSRNPYSKWKESLSMTENP